MTLIDLLREDKYEETVKKAKQIYKILKKQHPMLTDDDDVSFAVMYAIKNINTDTIDKDMSECYKMLKGRFFSGSAVKSLSEVLCLSDEPSSVKCDKVFKLYDEILANGKKYGKGFELLTLGVLYSLSNNTSEVADDICDVDEFLSHQKGFGIFSMTKRLMIATLIVTNYHSSCEKSNVINSTALNSSIDMLITIQNAAIMAGVMTSCFVGVNSGK